MELLAVWLVAWIVIGFPIRYWLAKGRNNREADRRNDQMDRDLAAMGYREGQAWLTPEQGAYIYHANQAVAADLALDRAKTAAHLDRMAHMGPGYAWAGAAIVGVGAYEGLRHHERQEWAEDRESYGDHGFDA